MKRSEVIEAIANELRFRSDESVYEIAGDVLKRVEEAGMLPPMICGIDQIHEWEPE